MEDNNAFFKMMIYFLAIIFWFLAIGGANIGIIIFIFVVLFPLIILAVIFKRSMNILTTNNEKRQSRVVALKAARLFLAPYQDIWKNLRLVNKYCSLSLGRDGKTITAREKKSIYNTECEYRSFYIIKSGTHTYEDLWNMFCLNFDNRTSYEELVELSKRFSAVICEMPKQNSNGGSKTSKVVSLDKDFQEKTDINNASEIELTALPGISIVLSKRIIKQRESIGGFKSVDDVFIFLKLKPHMEEQLRELICVTKMKGSVNINRYKERSIDL